MRKQSGLYMRLMRKIQTGVPAYGVLAASFVLLIFDLIIRRQMKFNSLMWGGLDTRCGRTLGRWPLTWGFLIGFAL